MEIVRSKSGLPCLWEAGGGMSNTGSAQVVAGPHGEAMKPLYSPNRLYSNGEHALFAMEPGMLIMVADYKSGSVTIYRYLGERVSADYRPQGGQLVEEAVLETVNSLDQGEWDSPLAPELEAAVHTAVDKAACYHCRHVHYAAR